MDIHIAVARFIYEGVRIYALHCLPKRHIKVDVMRIVLDLIGPFRSKSIRKTFRIFPDLVRNQLLEFLLVCLIPPADQTVIRQQSEIFDCPARFVFIVNEKPHSARGNILQFREQFLHVVRAAAAAITEVERNDLVFRQLRHCFGGKLVAVPLYADPDLLQTRKITLRNRFGQVPMPVIPG